MFVIFGLQIGISIWAFVEYGSVSILIRKLFFILIITLIFFQLEEAVKEGLKASTEAVKIDENETYKTLESNVRYYLKFRFTFNIIYVPKLSTSTYNLKTLKAVKASINFIKFFCDIVKKLLYLIKKI